MSFVLLSRKNKLMIFVLTSSTENSIGGSTIFISLKVNNWAKKNYKAKNNMQ